MRPPADYIYEVLVKTGQSVKVGNAQVTLTHLGFYPSINTAPRGVSETDKTGAVAFTGDTPRARDLHRRRPGGADPCGRTRAGAPARAA